jgi:hypothetical protein
LVVDLWRGAVRTLAMKTTHAKISSEIVLDITVALHVSPEYLLMELR